MAVLVVLVVLGLLVAFVVLVVRTRIASATNSTSIAPHHLTTIFFLVM